MSMYASSSALPLTAELTDADEDPVESARTGRSSSPTRGDQRQQVPHGAAGADTLESFKSAAQNAMKHNSNQGGDVSQANSRDVGELSDVDYHAIAPTTVHSHI